MGYQLTWKKDETGSNKRLFSDLPDPQDPQVEKHHELYPLFDHFFGVRDLDPYLLNVGKSPGGRCAKLLKELLHLTPVQRPSSGARHVQLAVQLTCAEP